MTVTPHVALVAVDWGTSHLRVWALGADRSVLGMRRSDEGMGATPCDRFAAILESHLEALGVAPDVPVVMCGMVGSRQGWAEAGYLPVPTDLGEIAVRAVRVPAHRRDIRILPGLSHTDSKHPDVMRGEETQLLGLARRRFAAGRGARMVCMPGTHSKWVRQDGLRVEGFASFMTGDTFSALSAHSVLRHSVGPDATAVDAASPDFRLAVAASLEAPSAILARLFSIRSAGLLQGLSPNAARARLSGYLIGQEIAGARARFAIGDTVELVGGGVLGELYAAALACAGIGANLHDGDELVIYGLADAASQIWTLDAPRLTEQET
ncbi:2-dehydro-3-deoxygalactonokinase [Oricola sp.]|uniref:2-dehydro-3-deoxygalactonokinase n=1 Tax=Oricola sp. TaxID=1979950 RepID=UPI003BA97437